MSKQWKKIPTRIMRIAPAHITVIYPFNILLLNASGPISLFMRAGRPENQPKVKRRKPTRAVAISLGLNRKGERITGRINPIPIRSPTVHLRITPLTVLLIWPRFFHQYTSKEENKNLYSNVSSAGVIKTMGMGPVVSLALPFLYHHSRPSHKTVLQLFRIELHRKSQ